MKKIGDVTSTADKNGEWTNGNVAAGIAPTILEAGWLNSVQREILGVIIAAGLNQDKNNDNQLVEAIRKIISGGNYAPAEDLKKYLAKDQNGADIPNKPKFIENLGLPERFVSGKLVKDIGSGQTALISPGGEHSLITRDSGTLGLFNNTTGSHVWRFDADGNMTIGMIPVGCGGTGGKTAAEARQNIEVYSRQESELLAVPVGGSIEWDSPHIKPPVNFMAKEGQTFDKSANPELAKVYPDGKLPDRRGRFPRVLDNGKGLDTWSDRPIGSEQDDTLQKITGQLSVRSVSGVLNTVHDMGGAIFASDAFGGTRALPLEVRSTGMQDSQFVNFDSGRVTRSSNETKPKNYAMQFYVRVR